MIVRGTVAKMRLVVLGVASMALASAINTDGNLGVARTLSARPLTNFKLNVQLGVNYGQESDLVAGPVDYGSKTVADKPYLNGVETPEVVDGAKLLSGNFALGIGLAPIWDVALSVPLYYDWLGVGDLAGGGLGDLEITTKVCAPPAGGVWFNTLLLGAVVPTGNEGGYLPRHPTATTIGVDTQDAGLMHTWNAVALKAMYLTSLDFIDGKNKAPFAIHLNAGVEIPFDGSGRLLGMGGLAMEYTPAPVISIFVDYSLEQRIDNLSSETLFRDPMHLTPGIRINTPVGIFLSLAYDACLCAKGAEDREVWRTGTTASDYTYSTVAGPTHGVQFMLGWRGFLNPQDEDKDNIKNADDRCPKDAEDIDGYQDSDGCPDYDNDSDGKPDSLDKCPNEAEDDDGFEDEDGCPDLDNDKDGIQDDKDKCPKDAEDFDGFEDKDGCPDPDNDKDGVADSLDRCPNDAEDFDKFEDDDGCADIDNDKDGIPDLKDKCPNQPETFNEVDDADGCPDVKKKESTMPKHQIVRGVAYSSGSAIMSPSSYPSLDPVAKELLAHTDIEIEIRGHTDATGRYETNMRLSQQRAEAVLQYLASKGIDPRRMRAVGYGPSSPIADNRSAAGRAQNRRIEIVRLK